MCSHSDFWRVRSKSFDLRISTAQQDTLAWFSRAGSLYCILQNWDSFVAASSTEHELPYKKA